MFQMAYFLIGCLFGGTVGFSFACLLFVGAQSDLYQSRSRDSSGHE